MRPRTGDSSEAVISWAWISHPAPASGTMETPPPARWRGGGGGGGHRPLIPTRPRRPARTASPARARHPPAPPTHAKRPGCLPTPPGAGRGPRTRGVFQRWGGGAGGGDPRCQPPWHHGALRGTSLSGTIRTRRHRRRVPPGSCHRAAGTCLTPLAGDRRLRVAVPAGDSRVPSPPKHPHVPTAPWPSPGHLRHPRATRHPGPRRCRAGGLPAQAVPAAAQMFHLCRDERIPVCLPDRWRAGGQASERGYPVPGSGVPANPPATAQGDGRCRAGRSGTGWDGGVECDLWSSVPLSRA